MGVNLFIQRSNGTTYYSGQNYGALFTETIGNPAWAIMGHFAFMFITIWVVSKGVQNGIEKQVNICCQRCSFYLSLLLFVH